MFSDHLTSRANEDYFYVGLFWLAGLDVTSHADQHCIRLHITECSLKYLSIVFNTLTSQFLRDLKSH